MNIKDLPLFSKTSQGASSDSIRSAEEPSSAQPKHWTVSELTGQIKNVLEPAFRQVWVQGELANCRPAASGHVYFSLKDDNASISAALFGWGAKGSRSFDLKDGLQVLCRGKLSIYPPRGSYQLIVESVEPLGAGALQFAFDQLKEKLAQEGLFDSRRKRPLPLYPSSIAVVTSPTGAAIQDILNILKRRAPQIRVLVIPALVQGEDAPRHLIRGVEAANRLNLGEIVIVARGGGSQDDLWCFNDEALARAIAGSRLPVVSAVGHEIDFTISDFVADLRAPTPSAAAEIVSGHWVDAGVQVRDSRARMLAVMQRELSHRKALLQHVAARVISPRDRLREQAQRCDELSMRLERAVRTKLERSHALLQLLAGKLDALSPLRVLERGYSLVRQEGGGALVRSSQEIKSGQKLVVTFHDGERFVQAI